MRYIKELTRAMTWLGKKDDTIFIGQTVVDKGTAMHQTFADVSLNKRIELPIVEDLQCGISLGLAINGYTVISVFPRWNFLLLGTNQIVNHLDKISTMSNGQFQPKVIIRTSIGSENPLFPSYQHVGDFTEAFQKMLTNIEVIRLDNTEDIVELYKYAYNRKDGKSSILVEWGDKYND